MQRREHLLVATIGGTGKCGNGRATAGDTSNIGIGECNGNFTLRKELRMMEPNNYTGVLKRINENNEKSREYAQPIRKVT